MHSGLLLGGLAAEPGAGHVAAIAVLHTAHIKQHAVALFQHGVIRLVVGVGGVGAKGYDGGKAGAFAAMGAEPGVDELGHLALGHAGLDVVLGFLVDQVVDVGGRAHKLLLGLILAGAAVIHAIAGQFYRHSGVGFHQRDQEPGGPFLIDAQRLAGIHHDGNLLNRRFGVGMPDSLARRVGHVEQLIQKKRGFACYRQVEDQQALVGFHGYAGQVPHALGVTYDHLGQAAAFQRGAHPGDTFSMNLFH